MPPPPQSTSAPSTATSSGLLPLLPPLPRAQALLHQMSHLAARLFDVSAHRSVWLASFRGSLPSFLSTSPPQPQLAMASLPSTTKEVVSLFTSLQTQLFEAVAELQEILDLQDSRTKLVRDCHSADASLLSFSNSIRDAVTVLDKLVDDYSDYLRPSKRSKKSADDNSQPNSFSLKSSLDISEVLAYAHRISYTTFAPPEHGAGAPLLGALPPAPQENEMRASQLYHFADLDVGVPKKLPEAKDRFADAVTEVPLIEPTPPREELPAVLPPPMLPISVPPGWRKGMPVEFLADLPPMPPGWKPGDPIPLPPPIDLGGNKGEDQRLPPRVPPFLPKAPEPTQVKFVQLDINPNEDDYSSEYSSDGSSEEDDD